MTFAFRGTEYKLSKKVDTRNLKHERVLLSEEIVGTKRTGRRKFLMAVHVPT